MKLTIDKGIKMDTFKENLGIFKEEDCQLFQKKVVLIVGLGGLGGYIAHGLVRLGFLKFILVDYDRFSSSNLNRQLFSTPSNIGLKKTTIIKSALESINPNLVIETYDLKIEALSLDKIHFADVIFDAVDSPQTKCYLEQLADQLKVPLVHGAIGGWFGQLGIIMPGKRILRDLYQSSTHGIEKTFKSPSFIPAIVAHLMILEYVKYLTQKPGVLLNRLLMIDTLNHDYQMVLRDKE